jgi:hypothetical protein
MEHAYSHVPCHHHHLQMTNWVVFTEPGAPPPMSAAAAPGDPLPGHIRTMSVSVLRSKGSQVTAPPPYPELLGPSRRGSVTEGHGGAGGQTSLLQWASLGRSHPSSPLLLSTKPSASGGPPQQQNADGRTSGPRSFKVG